MKNLNKILNNPPAESPEPPQEDQALNQGPDLSRREFLKMASVITATMLVNPRTLFAEDSLSDESQELTDPENINLLAQETLNEDLSPAELKSRLQALIENREALSRQLLKQIAVQTEEIANNLPAEALEEKALKSDISLEGPGAFYGFYAERLHNEDDADESPSIYGSKSLEHIKNSVDLNPENTAAVISYGQFVAGLKKHALDSNFVYRQFARPKIEGDFNIDIEEVVNNATELVREALENEQDESQREMLTETLYKLTHKQ